MSKRTKRIIGAIILVLISIVVGVYVWLNRDIEAEENRIPTPTLNITHDDPTSDAITPDSPDLLNDLAEDTRVYIMDLERTSLSFDIDSDVGNINGNFDIVGDWLALVPQDEGWLLVVVLRIDGRTADTGNGLVDSLLELGFEAERYPYGLYVSEADSLITDLTTLNRLTLIGQLELHGVIQEASVPIQIQVQGDELIANAQMTVDATDYNVQFASAIGGNVLNAKIRVFAHEASPEEIEALQAEISESD